MLFFYHVLLKCILLKRLAQHGYVSGTGIYSTNNLLYSGHSKQNTVKPVLSGHSKIDKTKVLKTGGSLMQVKSIAECSLGAFCNTFDRH